MVSARRAARPAHPAGDQALLVVFLARAKSTRRRQERRTAAAAAWKGVRWHDRGAIITQSADSPFVFHVDVPLPHPKRDSMAERGHRAHVDKLLRLLHYTAPTWTHHASYPVPRPQLSIIPPSLAGWTWAPTGTNSFAGTCSTTGKKAQLHYDSFNQPPRVEGIEIELAEQ